MSTLWEHSELLSDGMQTENTDYLASLEKEIPFVYPVLSSSELLAHESHQKLLAEMRQWVGSRARFDLYYFPLIEQFAYFVQGLKNPEGNTSLSMLNTALLRAHAALSFYRNRFLDVKPSYYYAAFSAILMRSVGSVDHSRRIELCDEKGTFISVWQPHIAPMPEGGFYKVRQLDNHYPRLSQLQNAIFARSLMPGAGLTWLAEDQNLFIIWLAYLNQYEEYSGSFGTDLDRIVADKQHKTLQGIADDKAFKPIEMLEYEYFLAWLKRQLQMKKLKINEKGSSVHVIKKKAVWISNDIVKRYRSDTKKRVVGAVVLAKFFNSMGIPSYGEYDFQYKGYFGAASANGTGLFGSGKSKELPKGGVVIQPQGLLGKGIQNMSISKNLGTLNESKNKKNINNKSRTS
jgi:hypothetical protein